MSLNPGGIPLAASADYTPRVGRVSRWLLLALLAWWTVRFAFHPLDDSFAGASFLHLINLPFHEAGHILFSPFGRTPVREAGTRTPLQSIAAAGRWRALASQASHCPGLSPPAS